MKTGQTFFFTFQVQLACTMEAEGIMLFLLPRRVQAGEKRLERKPEGRFIGRRKKMKGGISLPIFTEPMSLDHVFCIKWMWNSQQTPCISFSQAGISDPVGVWNHIAFHLSLKRNVYLHQVNLRREASGEKPQVRTTSPVRLAVFTVMPFHRDTCVPSFVSYNKDKGGNALLFWKATSQHFFARH